MVSTCKTTYLLTLSLVRGRSKRKAPILKRNNQPKQPNPSPHQLKKKVFENSEVAIPKELVVRVPLESCLLFPVYKFFIVHFFSCNCNMLCLKQEPWSERLYLILLLLSIWFIWAGKLPYCQLLGVSLTKKKEEKVKKPRSKQTLNVSLLDMKEGIIGDMAVLGVTESFQVKRQVLLSAAEAAEMILRVDDIIKAAPRYDLSICIGQLKWYTVICCARVTA